MKKIAVIGRFGFGKNLLNGQTIKTKVLTEALKEQIGEENVSCVDTHGGIKTLIKLVVRIYSILKKHDDVIMLPAHNGVLIFTPLLSFFNKFAKKKLHYVVIGGWLPEYLDKHKLISKLLKKNFKGIYVETRGMREKLRQRGFENAIVMPNCKKLDIVKEIEGNNCVPYKFCTFSRVMREKGIEDAVNAVKLINEQAGKVLCALDIYGQIDCRYEADFAELQKSFPEYIKYAGLVDFSKTTETLKKYYALLFPTYYDGEGFAGTIIDAFAAGIPVIASDWRYNTEIVEEGKTGFIYPDRKVDCLKERISELLKDSDARNNMAENCITESKKYLPDAVIDILVKKL